MTPNRARSVQVRCKPLTRYTSPYKHDTTPTRAPSDDASMKPITSVDKPRLLTDCLNALESLSVTSQARRPSRLSIHSRASSELNKDLTACTDHFSRTTELLKAKAGSIPDAALLDLKDRLCFVRSTASASSYGGSSSLNLLKDIRQSTQILDSFRKTVDLIEKLDQALDEMSGNIGSDTEDYIDGMNGEDDIPLPPPLKVSGTLWPKRRSGTDELLRHREKAQTGASRWQKGVLGTRSVGSLEVQSLAVRSKYLSCHCLIKVSARWSGHDSARTCSCDKVRQEEPAHGLLRSQ